jgi:phage FluMu protein Com
MQITCSCGKVLSVPENLAGKSARCPACKKILQMPGAAPAGASPPRIMMECSCGKKLAAPASAAGKTVRCPKCNQDLTVPGAAKTPSAPAIVPMPGPASHKVTIPTRPRTLAPTGPLSGDLSFGAEAATLPEDLPGGQAEKAEYGVGNPKCPNCKAELPYGAQFCVECGTSLATGTKLKPMAKAGVKRRKTWSDLNPHEQKTIIWACIAIVVGGLGIWYFYLKPHGSTAAEMREERAGEQAPQRRVGPRGGGE